jgi:hypothetical protein
MPFAFYGRFTLGPKHVDEMSGFNGRDVILLRTLPSFLDVVQLRVPKNEGSARSEKCANGWRGSCVEKIEKVLANNERVTRLLLDAAEVALLVAPEGESFVLSAHFRVGIDRKQ